MTERDGSGERERAAPTRVVETFVHDIATRATGPDAASLDALLPAVYDEMRVLAAYMLRGERSARTLRPTALAHEAYLRLAQSGFDAADGRHLLTVAATVMRRVLVDTARARRRIKRGGGAARITLSDDLVDPNGVPVDVVDLHDALDALAIEHPRKVRVVELLYFVGLTLDEAAEALELNERTVRRDWQFAKARLWQHLSPDAPDDDPHSPSSSA